MTEMYEKLKKQLNNAGIRYTTFTQVDDVFTIKREFMFGSEDTAMEYSRSLKNSIPGVVITGMKTWDGLNGEPSYRMVSFKIELDK